MMTKEQMYILGFNTALDRVKELSCDIEINYKNFNIVDLLDVVEELRDMVNGTNQDVDVF
jgi:hypothetical protein